jgi:hypothetical protein
VEADDWQGFGPLERSEAADAAWERLRRVNCRETYGRLPPTFRLDATVNTGASVTMSDTNDSSPTDRDRPAPDRVSNPNSVAADATDGIATPPSRSATRPRKTALAPDLRRLDDRAIRAWTERMAVTPLGGGEYAVDSESPGTYVVDARSHACTCPDHRIRGATCKHLRRVAIEISLGRVPPPGERRGTCAACGVETFVAEAADPPALCDTCRLESGDVVRDRESDDRLVVARVTGARADERSIPDRDCTVADWATNDGYPDDDIVVEAVYLADAARSENPMPYSFPHSRLARVDDAALVE